jgi:hypothetical protein
MNNYISESPDGFTWVQSDGGPLLFLESALLPSWNGGRNLNPEAAKSDYDPDAESDYKWACAVEGYLGLISIGAGTGLVIGGDPDMTAWWPLNDHHELAGVLVRWVYADSDAHVTQALQQIPQDIWQPSNITFKVSSDTLCLFDSACPGESVTKDNSLIIRVPVGSYSLSTAQYRPNPRIHLCLHGFMII